MKLGGLRSSQKAVNYMAKIDRPTLDALRELLEAGTVRPVVERSYELSEVAEALRTMGEGHVQGKLVITV